MLKEPITREEAHEATLKYFNGDELATDVWINKYALKDHQNNYYEKVPDDMQWRLAYEFARPDVKYEFKLDYLPSKDECLSNTEFQTYYMTKVQEYYELFKDYKYIIPQGSPAFALGNPFQIVSSSNCFTLPDVLDSYASIMRTDQELVQIMKRRGGVGFDISKLRPEGTPVKNAALTSSGVTSFMERFSNSTREVGQNNRRGALLLSISIHHPQIEDFIKIKTNLTKITGANISIRYSDEFMNAVKNDIDYEQYWPMEGPKQISKMVSAKKIWDMAMKANWKCAEPGSLFWDTVLKYTPSSNYSRFKPISVNPCSEIILGKFGACRLMLLCLMNFVKTPFVSPEFDWDLFRKHAYTAQHLMDNLVDLELDLVEKIIEKIKADPEDEFTKAIELNLWEEVKQSAIRGRRTGLGMNGVGDAIAFMNMKYADDNSIKFTEEVYKTLAIESYKCSIDLAESRGHFPDWNLEIEKDNEFLKRVIKELPQDYQEKYKKFGRRNIANLTSAPSGSKSCEAQCSSGLEPSIFISYIRRRKVNPKDPNVTVHFVDELGDSWEEYEVFHHGVSKWMDITGEVDIKKSPYYGATANEINWKKSVELQAAAQKWICHAISKTCNLPKDATVQDVSECYMEAWKTGCKGFTVYRDGSRSGVLVSVDDDSNSESFKYIDAFKRPEYMDCEIHKVNVKGNAWVVLVGLIDGRPYELYGGMCDPDLMKIFDIKGNLRIRKRKYKTKRNRYDLYNGDSLILNDILDELDNPNNAVLTRFVSLSLRHGARPSFLSEQLRKDPDASFNSFSKVLARVLKKYIEDGTKVSSEKLEGCKQEGQCNLIYQEGCVSCTTCGISKCS